MLPTRIPPASKGGPRTFACEDSLPKLPLPDLEGTLATLRRLVTPVCSSAAEEAEALSLLSAASSELEELQELLKVRHAQTDNYIKDWWVKYGYLQSRDAVVPIETATQDHPDAFDDSRFDQSTRAALLAVSLSKWQRDLHAQEISVDGVSLKQPWSMEQFLRTTSMARVPKVGEDEWSCNFDLNSPLKRQFVVVACRGRAYFKVYTTDDSLSPYPVGTVLQSVRACANVSLTPAAVACPVGVYTGSDRDEWARAREMLCLASKVNRASLEDVAKAVAVISLMDSSPIDNQSLLCETAYSTQGTLRWYDHTCQLTVYKNGRVCTSIEHSSIDAATQFRMEEDCYDLQVELIAKQLDRTSGKWATLGRLVQPELLEFAVNVPIDELASEWSALSARYDLRRRTYWKVRYGSFSSFGKLHLKRKKVSPDSFVQLAFQLAYRQLGYEERFGVPAVYSSVVTLKFKHARTEAGRAVHLETRHLMNAVSLESATFRDVRSACASISNYMRSCADGKGVDRHLFALKMASKLLNGDRNYPNVDAMFSSKFFGEKFSAWELSTSHCFLTKLQGFNGGSTCFRPVGPNSIGIVYGIHDDRIDVTVMTVNNNERKYDSEEFLNAFAKAMGKLISLQDDAKI